MSQGATPGAASFAWGRGPAGLSLACAALAPHAMHVFTSRELPFREPSIDADYARVGLALAVPGARVVRVRQVHGRTVAVVRKGDDRVSGVEADAIVSTDPGWAVSVRTADCVPILIADRHRRLVAAVHAGWRGTAAGAAGAAVEVIKDLGVPAADLVAAIGPAIGPCCYQVDAPVRAAFARWGPRGGAWFAADGTDRWKLDLWRANADQLVDGGVPADAVHAARICTVDHPDVCFSHRREGPSAGRMVAAIRIRT